MADLMPLLARGQYTDDEFALAAAGTCIWVLKFRSVPDGGLLHCGKSSLPDSHYRFCAGHDAEAREDPTYGNH